MRAWRLEKENREEQALSVLRFMRKKIRCLDRIRQEIIIAKQLVHTIPKASMAVPRNTPV